MQCILFSTINDNIGIHIIDFFDSFSGTSDQNSIQNSPASSLNVMSPPQSVPAVSAAPATLTGQQGLPPYQPVPQHHQHQAPPPTYLLPPLPPPPYVQSSFSSATTSSNISTGVGEHTRSNSVPADMNFLFDDSPF